MKLANVILAACMVLWLGVWAVGQAPPPSHDNQPPPPRDEMSADMDNPEHPGGPDQKDDRRGWWGRGKPMSEEEARDALAVLRRIDPAKADQLEKDIAENPKEIGQVLHDHFPNLGRFMAWKRFDPDGFDLRIRDLELSRQSRESAQRLRKAVDAKDDLLASAEREVLQGLVAEHFDVRQQIREHELAMLQRRIADLKAQLDQRADQRAELIAQRVDDLTHDHGDDRW